MIIFYLSLLLDYTHPNILIYFFLGSLCLSENSFHVLKLVYFRGYLISNFGTPIVSKETLQQLQVIQSLLRKIN